MSSNHRPDVYVRVHRGLRKALFDLVYAAGRTVWHDPADLSTYEALASEVIHFLHHHGENEDRWALPVLEAHVPGSTLRDSQEHVWIEREIARVERALADVRASAPELRQDAGDRYYHCLCGFVGAYLVHMSHEETEMQPLFHQHLSDDELRGIGTNIIANTSPADLSMMLGYMIPAADTEARAEFIGGIGATAPPAMFEAVLAIAKRTLTREEYAAVEERLNITA